MCATHFLLPSESGPDGRYIMKEAKGYRWYFLNQKAETQWKSSCFKQLADCVNNLNFSLTPDSHCLLSEIKRQLATGQPFSKWVEYRADLRTGAVTDGILIVHGLR